MPDPKETVEAILNAAASRIAAGATGGIAIAAAMASRLERPRNPAHGDFASSVALQIAGAVGRKPREIAEEIVRATQSEIVRSGACEPLEIAGPGFINIRLKQGSKLDVIRTVLQEGDAFG